MLITACAASDSATNPTPTVPSLHPSAGTPAASLAPAVSASEPVELADLLPRSLAGVELHTFAVGGDMVERLAATLGLQPTDVEVAYASEHGARFFQAYAMRAPGVGGGRLLAAFVASAYVADEGEVTRSEGVSGAKPVTVVSQALTAARLGTYYAYAAGEVLLVVQAFDPDVADEVLAALP